MVRQDKMCQQVCLNFTSSLKLDAANQVYVSACINWNVMSMKNSTIYQHTCFPVFWDIFSCSWTACWTLWTAFLAVSISVWALALSSSTILFASSEAYEQDYKGANTQTCRQITMSMRVGWLNS